MLTYLNWPPIFRWCVVVVNGFKPQFGSSSTNRMLDILGELGVEFAGFIEGPLPYVTYVRVLWSLYIIIRYIYLSGRWQGSKSRMDTKKTLNIMMRVEYVLNIQTPFMVQCWGSMWRFEEKDDVRLKGLRTLDNICVWTPILNLEMAICMICDCSLIRLRQFPNPIHTSGQNCVWSGCALSRKGHIP